MISNIKFMINGYENIFMILFMFCILPISLMTVSFIQKKDLKTESSLEFINSIQISSIILLLFTVPICFGIFVDILLIIAIIYTSKARELISAGEVDAGKYKLTKAINFNIIASIFSFMCIVAIGSIIILLSGL